MVTITFVPTEDDPIQELSHDHGHLSDLVQAVSASFSRIRAGELAFTDALVELEDGIESLREALLLHFAREEEGFFPFVEQHVPESRADVAALLADHDRVVRGAARLGTSLHEHDAPTHGPEAFASFVEIYAAHAQAESALLRLVSGKLSAEHRAELGQLLEQL